MDPHMEIKKDDEEKFERTPYEILCKIFSFLGTPLIKLSVALFRLIYPFFLISKSKTPFISHSWMKSYLFFEILASFFGICYTGLVAYKPESLYLTLAKACYIFLTLVYFSIYLYRRREQVFKSKKLKIEYIVAVIITALSILTSTTHLFKFSEKSLWYLSEGLKVINCIFILFIVCDVEDTSKLNE